MNKPALTEAEVKTILEARKILKKIYKKNIKLSDNIIHKTMKDWTKADKESMKRNAWQDELYNKAKIDFLSEEPFIEIFPN